MANLACHGYVLQSVDTDRPIKYVGTSQFDTVIIIIIPISFSVSTSFFHGISFVNTNMHNTNISRTNRTQIALQHLQHFKTICIDF